MNLGIIMGRISALTVVRPQAVGLSDYGVAPGHCSFVYDPYAKVSAVEVEEENLSSVWGYERFVYPDIAYASVVGDLRELDLDVRVPKVAVEDGLLGDVLEDQPGFCYLKCFKQDCAADVAAELGLCPRLGALLAVPGVKWDFERLAMLNLSLVAEGVYHFSFSGELNAVELLALAIDDFGLGTENLRYSLDAFPLSEFHGERLVAVARFGASAFDKTHVGVFDGAFDLNGQEDFDPSLRLAYCCARKVRCSGGKFSDFESLVLSAGICDDVADWPVVSETVWRLSVKPPADEAVDVLSEDLVVRSSLVGRGGFDEVRVVSMVPAVGQCLGPDLQKWVGSVDVSNLEGVAFQVDLQGFDPGAHICAVQVHGNPDEFGFLGDPYGSCFVSAADHGEFGMELGPVVSGSIRVSAYVVGRADWLVVSRVPVSAGADAGWNCGERLVKGVLQYVPSEHPGYGKLVVLGVSGGDTWLRLFLPPVCFSSGFSCGEVAHGTRFFVDFGVCVFDGGTVFLSGMDFLMEQSSQVVLCTGLREFPCRLVADQSSLCDQLGFPRAAVDCVD